jgi:hypothetical protein
MDWKGSCIPAIAVEGVCDVTEAHQTLTLKPSTYCRALYRGKFPAYTCGNLFLLAAKIYKLYVGEDQLKKLKIKSTLCACRVVTSILLSQARCTQI